LGYRALGEGDVAVVECLVDEEDNEQEADEGHYCQQPESPVPGCGVEDEGCEEWAEIGGEDYETGPDVDFTPVNTQYLISSYISRTKYERGEAVGVGDEGKGR
jgi:hypothetical protein